MTPARAPATDSVGQFLSSFSGKEDPEAFLIHGISFRRGASDPHCKLRLGRSPGHHFGDWHVAARWTLTSLPLYRGFARAVPLPEVDKLTYK